MHGLTDLWNWKFLLGNLRINQLSKLFSQTYARHERNHFVETLTLRYSGSCVCKNNYEEPGIC